MAMNPQSPSAVIMVRPHKFSPNPQTAADNKFQKVHADIPQVQVNQHAFEQVTQVAEQLKKHGIRVHLFEDEGIETPDSVFPNNWFSTHAGGHIAIYPMFAPNRRKERRQDIIEMLKSEYRVQDVVDYSGLEYDNIFLEGTGAMVLDHLERVAYAAKSNRTDSIALERFCSHFNFEPMVFAASDSTGSAIYHTNVLMCIGTDFVMAGFDMMTDEARRQEIIARFEDSGRQVISLSETQVNQFCGNALELQGNQGRLLAISQTAFDALSKNQIQQLEQSVSLLPLDVSILELAGGSVRCMLAGVHLSRR
ncbi:citrulline utilization hydrolase CtlX [Planctobacterium marinum]|uniref:Amidinotransferase n=1 Tax=Planctobacterium marinum TaxID=1631968 RepID=A0AA48HP52_9ALTE|nr:amidinotransferase [Planctobacterium marinum]